MAGGGARLRRDKRSLYLSALRSYLFNQLLACRVRAASWNQVEHGDVCCLAGSRSVFSCAQVDESIQRRAATFDIHPGLPLWGRGESLPALVRGG